MKIIIQKYRGGRWVTLKRGLSTVAEARRFLFHLCQVDHKPTRLRWEDGSRVEDLTQGLVGEAWKKVEEGS